MRALGLTIEVFGGMFLAGLFTLMLSVTLLAFFSCEPSRGFLTGTIALFVVGIISVIPAVRSPRNRLGWSSMGLTLLVLAGLYLTVGLQIGERCGHSDGLF